MTSTQILRQRRRAAKADRIVLRAVAARADRGGLPDWEVSPEIRAAAQRLVQSGVIRQRLGAEGGVRYIPAPVCICKGTCDTPGKDRCGECEACLEQASKTVARWRKAAQNGERR